MNPPKNDQEKNENLFTSNDLQYTVSYTQTVVMTLAVYAKF